jgi:hypothetical protein
MKEGATLLINILAWKRVIKTLPSSSFLLFPPPLVGRLFEIG